MPLIEAGRERARGLAKVLDPSQFAKVLCSPLLRARQTCEMAGYRDLAVIVEDLREWDYGEYEGLTTPEIRERVPSWILWRDGCPGGERPAEVSARADRVLERARGAGGDVLVFRLALSAGSVSALGFERKTEVLSRWNS